MFGALLHQQLASSASERRGLYQFCLCASPGRIIVRFCLCGAFTLCGAACFLKESDRPDPENWFPDPSFLDSGNQFFARALGSKLYLHERPPDVSKACVRPTVGKVYPRSPLWTKKLASRIQKAGIWKPVFCVRAVRFLRKARTNMRSPTLSEAPLHTKTGR